MPRCGTASLSKIALLGILSLTLACNEAERLRYKAERGDVEAMKKLGKKYIVFYDKDVNRNGELAIFWYSKAAEHEDSDAMVALGEIYEIHQKKEMQEKAYYWYLKAAEKGNINAMVALAQGYEQGNLNRKKDLKMWKYWMDRADAEHARK